MAEPVEASDVRQAGYSPSGRVERVEDGFKIVTFDPSRAPKARETIKAWFGPRKRFGPYAS